MKLQGRVKKGKQEPRDHHQTRHSPNSLFATDRLCYTANNENTILHENLLLAHLIQRLIGELIGYLWSGVRPSVCVVRPSASSTMLKDLLLRKRFANQSQILCGAFLGRGDDILFAASGSHNQDSRHAHIWLKPFKNLLLQNRQTDFHETWYVASGTPGYHSLFK